MANYNDRTKLLMSQEKIEKIEKSHVAVFGIGGVGGHAAEALVRAGIGELTIVDADVVDITNINRQLFATALNIGQDKVLAAKERLLAIRPDLKLHPIKSFYSLDNAFEFDLKSFDYIIDAIDTISAKTELIVNAKKAGTPIISAMGAGGKLNPQDFLISDIYKTSVCPLARVMRKKLKERGVSDLKVVYSKEEPVSQSRPPGSISFVPSAMGLILAGEVIKDIVGI